MKKTPEQKEKYKLADKLYRERNKELIKEKRKEYYENNKELITEKNKEYILNNIGKVKERKKEYRENNSKSIKLYREINKEDLKEKRKVYNEKNKDKIKQYNTTYKQSRRENDPIFKLTGTLRTMMLKAFKQNGYSKTTKTHKILGCSFEEFKSYLESKFEPWMNWDNKGNWNGIPTEINTAWDIDHIIPLSTAVTEDDIIRLNHYTNLQPLCSYTNRYIKKNKY